MRWIFRQQLWQRYRQRQQPRLWTPWLGFCLALGMLTLGAAAEAVPHRMGLLSSLKVGGQYSSLMMNRGVILYEDFQLDPIVGVFLFDDRLEVFPNSIGYRDFIYGETLRLRTRLKTVTDRPLFPSHASVRDGNPMRENSAEFSARLEFFLPAYDEHFGYELNLGYVKDISAHWGDYFEVQLKRKLFAGQFLNHLMEPNLVVSVGGGTASHDRYYYGPSAGGSTLNNLSYGVWIAFPEDADRSFPIIQLMRFEVLGEKNASAEFARGRNEGWIFSILATHELL